MAIYHLAVKSVSRSTGRSVVAAIGAERLALSSRTTCVFEALVAAVAAVGAAAIVPASRWVLLEVVATMTGRYKPTKVEAA